MILALQAGVATLRQPSVADLHGRKVLTALAVLIVAAWVALAVMTAGGMSMTRGGTPAPTHTQPARMTRGMSGMSGMPGMKGGMKSIPGMAGMSGMSDTAKMGRVGPSLTLGASSEIRVMWVLMIVAMMLPSALPGVAYTASRSLRWRRSRAMVQFALGYVAIWLIASAAILLASGLVGAGRWVLASVLGAAVLWQITPPKRRALLDCHRSIPLPPSGWSAELASVRFGLRNGWACVRSCWAMMLVMGVASTAVFAWMLAITVLAISEKLSERPRRASERASLALALAAAASVLIAVV